MPFKNILCFGTINPDFIYFVDELPDLGGDIRSKDYKTRPGGTAVNCAENIANWGVDVAVAGNSIGNDEFGKYITNYLDISTLIAQLRQQDLLIFHSKYLDNRNKKDAISTFFN